MFRIEIYKLIISICIMFNSPKFLMRIYYKLNTFDHFGNSHNIVVNQYTAYLVMKVSLLKFLKNAVTFTHDQSTRLSFPQFHHAIGKKA
jgi:hypothetical protein